jgi:hypothetical protein
MSAIGMATEISPGGAPNHVNAFCHRFTAAAIFAAEEFGTLAVMAAATRRRGAIRSSQAPWGTSSCVFSKRREVMTRSPSAVATG